MLPIVILAQGVIPCGLVEFRENQSLILHRNFTQRQKERERLKFDKFSHSINFHMLEDEFEERSLFRLLSPLARDELGKRN